MRLEGTDAPTRQSNRTNPNGKVTGGKLVGVIGGELVGMAEIVALFGVTRPTVYKWRRTSFPEPVAELAAGPVWRYDDIARWAAETGRRLLDDRDA